MRGERYQNGMAILLTVLVFAAIPLIVNLPTWWFLWVPVVAALAVLPAVFLREVDIGTSPRSPGDVREALSSTLRTAGVSTTAVPDAVLAQVNALSRVVSDRGSPGQAPGSPLKSGPSSRGGRCRP